MIGALPFVAIDLRSSSFAPRQSVQVPSALGLASVRCHSANKVSACHFAVLKTSQQPKREDTQ